MEVVMPEKNPVGRPRTSNHNEEEVRKLAKLGLSYKMIGDFFGVSASTIEKNYSAAIKEEKSHLGKTIRTMIVGLALEKQDRTAIFYLDKVLNERDNQTANLNGQEPLKSINLKLVSNE